MAVAAAVQNRAASRARSAFVPSSAAREFRLRKPDDNGYDYSGRCDGAVRELSLPSFLAST